MKFFEGVDVHQSYARDAHPLSRGSAAPQADARWAQRQYSTIWASLGPQTLRAPAADEKLGVVAETELEADVDFWSPGERGPLAMGMIREDR